mmetsp:Transcript_4653/g.7361  ORF Transcript_4653/g.7361 Transcript_4653/m.7361 type:complete len:100 (+) Transcript_4653:1014-1313(+)
MKPTEKKTSAPKTKKFKNVKMKLPVEQVVKNMSPEVRKQVEIAAERKGMPLDMFVHEQLTAQIVDQDVFTSNEVDWDISGRGDPRRGDVSIGGGIRGRV